MNTLARRAGLLTSILCLGLASPLQSKPHRPGEGDRIAQAMLEDLQHLSGVPGLSAAVWQDGSITWTGAAGMRDLAAKRPVTADTRFRLASVSKLFAVTAAAKLAEEGRLDLDAPVATILPWLQNDWPAITARQLAAHTAGLPHYQNVDIGRGATRYATARDAVAIFSNRPLLSPPGSRYSYSSWGYTLLGALVEAQSRQHLGDYVRGHIAPGLDVGLDATGADPKATVAYEFTNKQAVAASAHDFSYSWAGGGLMASAGDLVRFGGAMLADRIVSRASFDRMLVPARLASGGLAGEDGYTVGFGWRNGTDSDGRPIAFHNGTTTGARSSLLLWRREGVAAAILSNASWTSAIDRTAEMLAAPFRTAAPPRSAPPCPTDAKTFQGRFGEVAVSGPVTFTLRHGLCRGELAMPSPMVDYFASGPQPGSKTLRIVGLSIDGTLARAGLVTPFGIYDLRANLSGGGYTSPLSSSREFSFALSR